jgi:glycosyltransferase involved in cell wall biosynthesis
MATVSALVCTRNRPDSLIRTVRSLLVNPGGGSDGERLRNDGGQFELIVIDQSEGSESELRLAGVLADPRLRLVRSGAQGKGAALNEGLRLARGEVVVCTDDDCEVSDGWAMQMARILEAHPTVALVFCNVVAAPYDPAVGYVPTYERQSDRLLRSIAAARHGLGLGAGMAVRRAVVLGLGGFDEALGPGSRFASGDDWDISLRLLLKGWHVYDTAQLSVLHYGFRTLSEGRDHALRDWVAIGALCAKPIRAGYLSAVMLSVWLFSTRAIWPPLSGLLRLQRPSGRSRIVGFVRGFVAGLRTPVDRATLTFGQTDR